MYKDTLQIIEEQLGIGNGWQATDRKTKNAHKLKQLNISFVSLV